MVETLALASGLYLFVGISPGSARADRPVAQLVAMCAACHRLDHRPNGIPPIVSLNRGEFISMMRGIGFRTQSYPTMSVVSRELSPTEVVAIADYLGQLDQEKAP